MQAQISDTKSAHKSLGRFWIALAVVGALALMLLSAYRQGWFTPTGDVFVQLEEGAQGVQVGTQVKLKGFKIGEVDEAVLEPSLSVRVRMRVPLEKLKLLGSDAQVKLTRDSPIAPKYFEFLAGDRRKGSLQADKTVLLNTGGDVEDVMLVAKATLEKLNTALAKVAPILDDTKKLTGEAADMQGNIHKSVDVMLANFSKLSGQLKEAGQKTNGLMGKVDADREALVGKLKSITSTVDATVSRDIPQMSDKVKAVLDNVKHLSDDAAQDIPPALRSSRSLTQDVAEITEGAKKTWPISSMVKNPSTTGQLPLDAFEAQAATGSAK